MKPIVLLTGGSGFVGSAIASTLLDEFDVWSVAKSHPCATIARNRNIFYDIADPDGTQRLAEKLPAEPIYAVVHAAASTPRTGGRSLEEHFQANVFGTERLLCALPSRPSRLAYLSTVDVYGRQSGVNEDSPAAPLNAYALSKYTGELIAYYWATRFDCSLGVFRLGQVYGPKDPTAKAVASFCRAAALGEPPQVAGAGAEKRQPIYLDDVAGGIKAWLTRTDVEPFRNFLLCGSETISIAELAGLVMKCAGIPGNPRFGNASKPAFDNCFDNSDTRRYLGWSPVVTLAEGIHRTLLSMKRLKV